MELIAAFAHCWFAIAWALAGVVLVGFALLTFRRKRTSPCTLGGIATVMFVFCIGLTAAGATSLFFAYESVVFQLYVDHPPAPVGT